MEAFGTFMLVLLVLAAVGGFVLWRMLVASRTDSGSDDLVSRPSDGGSKSRR